MSSSLPIRFVNPDDLSLTQAKYALGSSTGSGTPGAPLPNSQPMPAKRLGPTPGEPAKRQRLMNQLPNQRPHVFTLSNKKELTLAPDIELDPGINLLLQQAIATLPVPDAAHDGMARIKNALFHHEGQPHVLTLFWDTNTKTIVRCRLQGPDGDMLLNVMARQHRFVLSHDMEGHNHSKSLHVQASLEPEIADILATGLQALTEDFFVHDDDDGWYVALFPFPPGEDKWELALAGSGVVIRVCTLTDP
jgi:hypothetical protein